MTSQVDERPPAAMTVVLGFQHVVVMYTGCVTVPLVFGAAARLSTSTIGLLVNADLLVAGLMTLVQSLGVRKLLGVRLPVIAGASFTAVTPMILIAAQYGIRAVYGSMIAAGLFGLLIAVPFSRIVRFFPPVVRGTAVTVIGLSLIGAAANLVVGSSAKAAGYASPAKLGLAAGIIIVALALALALGMGMLPVIVPGIYHSFPSWVQIIAGGAITSAVITAFVLNLFFNHLAPSKQPATETADMALPLAPAPE
jgi:NCS2 family nucleobase:cation symporter-2